MRRKWKRFGRSGKSSLQLNQMYWERYKKGDSRSLFVDETQTLSYKEWERYIREHAQISIPRVTIILTTDTTDRSLKKYLTI